MVFLKRTSDKFKKLHPDIAVNKKYFRIDGAGQNFKHKYINCSTCLMKKETEQDFSATSHGKEGIDGLGDTCKQRVREKMKQHVIDLQTSLEFTNCVSEISLNTNIILCPTEIIKNSKHSLDSSTMINGTNIPNIHGTRKQFQKSPLL